VMMVADLVHRNAYSRVDISEFRAPIIDDRNQSY